MRCLASRSRLGHGVPSYQVEDEEGRIHLLLHLPIDEENEDRWCLWRPDQAGFDSRSIFEGASDRPNSFAAILIGFDQTN